MHHNDKTAKAFRAHCCPCGSGDWLGVSRRGFLGGAAALGGIALTGLSWSALAAEELDVGQAPPRRPLVVKPVLGYNSPQRRPQTSWREWGGVQTREDFENELSRINAELKALEKAADFPLKFLPVSAARNAEEIAPAKKEIAEADAAIVYAAGGWQVLESVNDAAKNMIIFCRHKSGPLYLWYEIISARYLRQHTDHLAVKGVDDEDVVVDKQDDILWRLRALCGLQNTLGAKVLAVGGPAGWAHARTAPQLAKERFQLDIQSVSYAELGKLIKEARADNAAVDEARRRADNYLKIPGTTLETERIFVDNAFLLERIFRSLLKKTGCRAITINNCMDTIIPVAETTACLPLSTLNDDGYTAFCESDFVVIPTGILLANISGKPSFLNDPTYPHDGVVTQAHCTGPRKMDGRRYEPTRIVTHFESDYGAATKVEMPKGQVVTNVIADFDAKHYVGFRGKIIDAPFLPICRDQIDVAFECDSLELAKKTRGFHWMTCYGDYLKEFGYALKRTGIEWEVLT
ncbi:MAG: hypothetical protein JW959_05695 [Pirellulales bacterium]|nr:hypothetical protein [Pirellulales bacterium]